MKTIVTVAKETDGEVVCSFENLADAEEMILELSREDAYETFVYCTQVGCGQLQTAEEFWKGLENDIEWAKNRSIRPILSPYWNLVDVCADGYFILTTILFS